MLARRVLQLLGLAVVLVAGHAAAEPTAADKAAAEALFQDARRLMDEGHVAAACPKLVASNRLDHGIGVLLFLADCYERNGQTASAWATFLDAEAEATAAGQKDRAGIASARVAALEPRLVRLSIEVPDGVRAVPGLIVRLDGKPLPAGAFGVPVPVDPGPHEVEASAPGRITTTATAVVGLDTPQAALTLVEPMPAPDPGPRAAPPSASIAPRPAPAAAARGLGTQRTVSVLAGGAGLAALVSGAILGLRAKSQYDEAHTHCRTDTLCDPVGLAGVEDAERSATASTILFAAGATALAAGVVLLLTAPSGARSRAAASVPVLGRAARGAGLGLTW